MPDELHEVLPGNGSFVSRIQFSHNELDVIRCRLQAQVIQEQSDGFWSQCTFTLSIHLRSVFSSSYRSSLSSLDELLRLHLYNQHAILLLAAPHYPSSSNIFLLYTAWTNVPDVDHEGPVKRRTLAVASQCQSVLQVAINVSK